MSINAEKQKLFCIPQKYKYRQLSWTSGKANTLTEKTELYRRFRFVHADCIYTKLHSVCAKWMKNAQS